MLLARAYPLMDAYDASTPDILEPPTAYLDSISPNPATEGDEVSFIGHGTDADGSIVGYKWTSNIFGLLSTSQYFLTPDLPFGKHNITFKVEENDRSVRV